MRTAVRVLTVFLLLTASRKIGAADPVPVTLDSKILGETRTVFVRTPASYDRGGRAYPVIYMTDGERQLTHLAALADFLLREGRMPEVIIVGIGNTDRTRDLTPTKIAAFGGGGQAIPVPTSGGGERFLDFIASELMPWVETNYRTQPYRVFAGHSFGGLLAMHAFLTRPALFNAVIAVSPTLTWDDRHLYRRAEEWAKKPAAWPRTLLMSVGDEGEELDREFDAIRKLISRKGPPGLEFEAIRYPDEDHGSVVLPTHYAGLRKAFEPFRFSGRGITDPTELHARAREHYRKASVRLGFELPMPETTANTIGYRLLQTGHLREAIEVFTANARAWPDSANVYDSLGEAQEKAGALDLALANYRRAADIGRKTGDPNTAIFEQNAARIAQQPGRTDP